MTKLDDFTLGLLTNDEVLAVDQDPLGKQAKRISVDPEKGTEVWARPLADGTMAVGLFNRGRYELIEPSHRKGHANAAPLWKMVDRSTGKAETFVTEASATAALKKTEHTTAVSVSLAELHLSDSQPVRDLWRHKDLPSVTDRLRIKVPPHGAAMIKIGRPREE